MTPRTIKPLVKKETAATEVAVGQVVEDPINLLDISGTIKNLAIHKLQHIPRTPISQGIYSITNNNSRQIYIGSSRNIYKRLREHIKMLVTNTHHSYKLQQSYNTHGISPFSFQIVELVDNPLALFPVEQKWMDIYTANKTYKMMNVSKTADPSHYVKKRRRRATGVSRTKTKKTIRRKK